MKIETITVTRTIQVRQYEPLVMSATATLHEGEPPRVAFEDLHTLVMAALAAAQGGARAARAQALIEDTEYPDDSRR